MIDKNLFGGIFRNKKIIITGDTGFKGSWMSAWLTELGASVYGYSLPPKTQKDNFVKCNLKNKINHLDGDVRDRSKLQNYFSEVKPDLAFHLAAQPLVIDSYNDPHYTFETNIMGTVNFFESVRNTKSVHVAINITSDKCYKNNEWIWGYRENEPIGGDDPYSASKGCSELITNSYLKSFFLKEGTACIASVRAGNVIGGGDWAENRIVPDFFRALEKNEILQLRNPDATRPWQHILEPLSGYLHLASKLYREGDKYSGGWNFGPLDLNNYTVRQLVETMIKISGKGKYIISSVDEKAKESGLLKLDISKAQTKLGWNPVLDFNETTSMTVDGYIDENDADIYSKRIQQILKYVNLAKQKKISWAVT